MKAPAWLFSAESDQAPPSTRVRLGAVRVDATAWAAAPWVLLPLCARRGRAPTEEAPGDARVGSVAPRGGGAGCPPRVQHDQLRRAMIGYAAPLDCAPSQPAARAALKLLAAAAAALGRTPVLPALRCAQPLLQKRCAWLVPPSRDGGSPSACSAGRRAAPTRCSSPPGARRRPNLRARSRRAPPPRSSPRSPPAPSRPPASPRRPRARRRRGCCCSTSASPPPSPPLPTPSSATTRNCSARAARRCATACAA